jgi:hypothetical protein
VCHIKSITVDVYDKKHTFEKSQSLCRDDDGNDPLKREVSLYILSLYFGKLIYPSLSLSLFYFLKKVEDASYASSSIAVSHFLTFIDASSHRVHMRR